jgi:hypothetical protein
MNTIATTPKLSDIEKELLLEQLFCCLKTKDKVEQWLRNKVHEVEFEILSRESSDERQSLEEWNQTLDFFVKRKHEFNFLEKKNK